MVFLCRGDGELGAVQSRQLRLLCRHPGPRHVCVCVRCAVSCCHIAFLDVCSVQPCMHAPSLNRLMSEQVSLTMRHMCRLLEAGRVALLQLPTVRRLNFM